MERLVLPNSLEPSHSDPQIPGRIFLQKSGNFEEKSGKVSLQFSKVTGAQNSIVGRPEGEFSWHFSGLCF